MSGNGDGLETEQSVNEAMVGERECDKILREMIAARDASLERARLARAEAERLQAAYDLDRRAAAWAALGSGLQ